MNGYLNLSDRVLAAHREAPKPQAQPLTTPPPPPRPADSRMSEAFTSSDMEEAPLDAQKRNALPDSAFALPGRRYPIDTRDRARAALSRAEQFASDDEQRSIRSAVRSKYKDMDVS